MIFSISSVYRATSLYNMQKTYSDRVKAYSPKRKVIQAQRDKVSLSPEAKESLSNHRVKKQDAQPIYYSNPRLSNA